MSFRYGNKLYIQVAVSRINNFIFKMLSLCDCAGEALQQLQITGPSSRQRGRPIITIPQLSKNNFKKQDWLRAPDDGLTPEQSGRLSVGHKITNKGYRY
jgi:hypothetical protein